MNGKQDLSGWFVNLHISVAGIKKLEGSILNVGYTDMA